MVTGNICCSRYRSSIGFGDSSSCCYNSICNNSISSSSKIDSDGGSSGDWINLRTFFFDLPWECYCRL